MYSSLRSYHDILTIEANKRGLEEVIAASADIFELTSMHLFAHGVLKQIISLLNLGGEPQQFTASYDEFLNTIHPDDRDHVTTAVELAVTGEEVYCVEHRIVRRNGEIRLVHEQGEVTRNADGEPTRMIGTVQDNTDRRRAEERSARFGRILNRAFNEIYVFDSETLKFTDVTVGARENLGYTMDELREITPVDIKPEFTLQEFKTVIGPLLADKRNTAVFETVHQRKDGTTYPVDVRLQLTEGSGSRDFVAIIEDITERRRVEQSMQRLNEQLEERVRKRTVQLEGSNSQLREALATLEQTQDQLVELEKLSSLASLVAGVAHEINTPIGTGVTAASHLDEMTSNLQKSYAEGNISRPALEKFIESSRQSTQMLMSNLDRAANLIRNFKQVAVDQSTEDARNFNLRRYIDEVPLSLRPRLKVTRHKVTVTGNKDIVIEGFPGAISQIITNLVMNSLVHAYDENDAGKIEIALSQRGGQVAMNYSDDGKGVPEDVRKKMFDPFFTTRRGSGSTGLGLNILYNLVTKKLGGTVECHSGSGKGIQFDFVFPASSREAETSTGVDGDETEASDFATA